MAKLKWVVEIQVDQVWVADGFDLTDERVHRMVTEHLPHVYGHEVKGKVISRPDDVVVAELQGYKTVSEYRKDRDK